MFDDGFWKILGLLAFGTTAYLSGKEVGVQKTTEKFTRDMQIQAQEVKIAELTKKLDDITKLQITNGYHE